MRTRTSILFTLALLLGGCSTFPSAHERPVDHLEQVLLAYAGAHPGNPFPKDVVDLEHFASLQGAPFDPAVIDISVTSADDYVFVRYTVKYPEKTSGQIALGEKLH